MAEFLRGYSIIESQFRSPPDIGHFGFAAELAVGNRDYTV
jgi:hypothetical protein